MSAPPRDVPYREAGAAPLSRLFDGSSSRRFEGSSSRTFEGSHPTQQAYPQPDPRRQDVWSGAIARLQTQVSYNTSMLESNRRQMSEVENSIRRLDRDMGIFVDGMNQLREEFRFRVRPASAQEPKADAGDLDLLSRQVQTLTDKVNEVDGLRMQIDLMKNRMRRFEEQGSPPVMAARELAPPTREPSFGETQQPAHPPLQPPSRPLQQPLPPMRTSSMGSPAESRSSLFHQPPQLMPVLQSQHSASSYYPSQESRHMSVEPLAGQASSTSGYRPGEPLPPPSAISAWRPAESSQQQTAHPPPPPPPPPGPVQPRAVPPGLPGSGWATVNPHPATKRSFDEPRQSPYESSVMGGSPKRPKLAPIMPRGVYHDDSSYVPSSMTQSTADSSYSARNRTGSNASQTQSSMLPTPASANAPAYRFITSTGQADSQESWRPELERTIQVQQHQPAGRGRGRGSRSGGRGRRGGRAGQQQDMGTPEWEKPGWTGSQVSPNGYYQPGQAFSPRQDRGEMMRRGGVMMGGPSEHEHITPATPVVQGSQDPFAVGPAGEGQQTSGGKKSRTKPIRNAEGILIRKDGRPDMRSVSSANNLRKVHAKKEAERAEMEGRTPTSARSLAPAGSNSLSEEDEGTGSGEEREHETTQERHQALMSRIFPQGAEEASRGVGERFFPRQEATQSSAVESEPRSEEEQARQTTATDSQMTDADMRAKSEAQAEEQGQRQPQPQDEDVKMATVEEARREKETESERRAAGDA